MTYPGTDPFGVTSVSPSVVSTAGGQLVTISGTAIPTNVVVRVGSTATAEVVSVAQGPGGHAVVRVPARAAGVYDVLLSGGGQQSSLRGALTYTGGGTAPATPAPTPTGAPSPSASSTPPPATSSPVAPQEPSTSPPSPAVVTTPSGLVLRRSAQWASVSSSLWLVRGCETSCIGTDV